MGTEDRLVMRDMQGVWWIIKGNEKKRGKHYNSFLYLSKWYNSRCKISRKEHRKKWGEKQNHSNYGEKWSAYDHQIWLEWESSQKFKDKNLQKESSKTKSRRLQWTWWQEYWLIFWGRNNELKRPCRTETIFCKKTQCCSLRWAEKDGKDDSGEESYQQNSNW